jgi:hemerythrin-like domain-containing protein
MRNESRELSALSILKEDHAKLKSIFSEFEKLQDKPGADADKGLLVKQACDFLTMHTRLEEEVFYPAARRALSDAGMNEEVMDEAKVEHEGAQSLVSQLISMKPGESLFDAKFVVLAASVRQHIREEEGRMFPMLEKVGLDTPALGQQLQSRRQALKLDIGIVEEGDLAILRKPERKRAGGRA